MDGPDGWLVGRPDSFDDGIPASEGWARAQALDTNHRWLERAACRGKQEVMLGEDTEAARAVCDGCPVVDQCLHMALDTEDPAPVWAGLTWEERVRLCPICHGPKEPEHLGCNFAHTLARVAQLAEADALGHHDISINRRVKPSARTYAWCPLPRGLNHSSVEAYRQGCRCEASMEARREKRRQLRSGTTVRGPYRRRMSA